MELILVASLRSLYSRMFVLCKQSRRAWRLQTLVLLVTVNLLITGTEAGSCRKRLTRQTINHQDCQPKRLLTFACVGSCFTHTQISSTNPFELEHTCYQCKEAAVSYRRVKLVCPNESGPNPFEERIIEVPVPRECQCELCSTSDSLEVSSTSQK